MKRIIALSSFLFLFLLAVLPANVSHAAEAVNVKGISLKTDKDVIEAKGTGNNNFTLDLIGVTGDVKNLVITSDNADSATIPGEPSLGLPDITGHFLNGKLDVDKNRFLGWLDKPENASFKQAYNFVFPQYQGTDTIVSLQDIRDNFYNEDVVGGYVTDINGNQSEVNITLLVEGWKLVNGKWYLYDIDAQKITGWYQDDETGKWYYLDPKADGAMVTGWFKVNGKWYFFNPSGDMKTGWHKEKGKWYHLDELNGDMSIGWDKIGGKWYYFDANGVMKTGWIQLSKKWYYLDSVNGDMKTGWVKLANKWYYLDLSSGAMKTGKVKIGSKYYTFASDGHWLY